jgi:hypothetical protein
VIFDIDGEMYTPITTSIPISIGNVDALAEAAQYRAHCVKNAMDDLTGRSLFHKWGRAMVLSKATTVGVHSITGVPKKDFRLLKHVIAELCAVSIGFLRDPFFIQSPSESNRYQLIYAILRTVPELQRLRCTAERLLGERLLSEGFFFRTPRAERDRVRRANDGLVWYTLARIVENPAEPHAHCAQRLCSDELRRLYYLSHLTCTM